MLYIVAIDLNKNCFSIATMFLKFFTQKYFLQMKSLFYFITSHLFLLLFTTGSVRGQSITLIPVDKLTGKIQYNQTVNMPNKKQPEITSDIQTWLNKSLYPHSSPKILANTVSIVFTRSFEYKYQGRIKKIHLQYSAMLCSYDGYYEAQVDNFFFLFPNSSSMEAEIYLLKAETSSETGLQFLHAIRQKFIEAAASITNQLQSIYDKQGRLTQ